MDTLAPSFDDNNDRDAYDRGYAQGLAEIAARNDAWAAEDAMLDEYEAMMLDNEIGALSAAYGL